MWVDWKWILQSYSYPYRCSSSYWIEQINRVQFLGIDVGPLANKSVVFYMCAPQTIVPKGSVEKLFPGHVLETDLKLLNDEIIAPKTDGMSKHNLTGKTRHAHIIAFLSCLVYGFPGELSEPGLNSAGGCSSSLSFCEPTLHSCFKVGTYR